MIPAQTATPTQRVAPPTDAECLTAYRQMVRTRAFDRQMVVLQRQGKIGFTIQSEGEEACHVGTAAHVDPSRDWVFPSYRQQGIALALGVNPTEMSHQMFGNAKDAGSRGRQMPVHFSFLDPLRWVSISSPLGTQIPQAVGAARAMQLRGENGVAFCCFGDGSTSTNGFHSGMVFAGVWKVPVVMVCDNNQWAISVPTNRQTASSSFAVKGKAYGVRGVVVDGNDFFEMWRAVGEATATARAGGGPTLIEAVTYRIGGHSSSDDPRRYRDERWLAEAVAKDPIARLEKYLTERGVLTAAEARKIADDAAAEMREASDAAASVPAPPVDSMFEDVYAVMPQRLRQQQAELRAELERHGANTEAIGAFPL